MKTNYLLLPSIVLSLIFINSCELITEDMHNDYSRLTFKTKTISEGSDSKDTIIFTGKDIDWFNITTSEIQFKDSSTKKTISNYHNITCYLNSDSLFTACCASDIMSFIHNDLVLYHNLYEDKYYFKDGYPCSINNPQALTLRAQNKEKRGEAWTLFTAQIEAEGKLREQSITILEK